jgi:hypothetical protein
MSFPADNLAYLQQQLRAAHLRHSLRSWANGFDNAFRLWQQLYEARAAIADQNPTFAATLLSRTAPLAMAVPGLPLIPSGVRWAVDEVRKGSVVVSIEVAGGTILVKSPEDKPVVIAPGDVTRTTTRTTFVFKALQDGLYTLTLSIGAIHLATVYVPVQRAEFLRFRKNSNHLAFGFRADKSPKPDDAYLERLAFIIAADAAAATGHPKEFYELSAAGGDVAEAPEPIALYPNI